MSLLYDIILALIVILVIRRGWKAGVLAGLIVLLGWVVSAVIIAGWDREWAEGLYFRFVEPAVIRAVEKAIPADVLGAMNSGADALNSVSDLQDVLNSLGGVMNTRSLQLGDVTAIQTMLRQDGTSLAEAVTKTVLQPAVVAVIQCAVALVVVAVVMMVFRGLARKTKRRHKGLLGKTNQILGAALGVVGGAACACVYALALMLLASLINKDWLSPAVVENTTLVSGLLNMIGI